MNKPKKINRRYRNASIFTNKWRNAKKSDLPLITGIIYKYTNKINGKIYIGQTMNEKARKYAHKNNRPKGENSLFHNAIDKYGWDNFEYKVLFKISSSSRQDLSNSLDSKERLCIKYYDTTNKSKGYNIDKGGNSGTHTRKDIEYNNSKIKLSVSKPVVQLSLEWEYITEYENCYVASEKTGISRSSIHHSATGITFSSGNSHWVFKEEYELHKNNISSYIKSKVAKIGRYKNYRDQRIAQLTKDGTLIKIWKNTIEISKALNISQATVSRVINGKVSSSSMTENFSWRRYEDYFEETQF